MLRFNPDAPSFVPTWGVSVDTASAVSRNDPPAVELPQKAEEAEHVQKTSPPRPKIIISEPPVNKLSLADESGADEPTAPASDGSCIGHLSLETKPTTHAIPEGASEFSSDQQSPFPLNAQVLGWNWGIDFGSVGAWRCRPSVVTWYMPALEPETPKGDPTPHLHDFEILRLVGQGGFGKVYQVRKAATGRLMALKAMRKDVVIQELNVEGTRNEKKCFGVHSASFCYATSLRIP
mmetsp:Transcript_77826/g.209740  ORF Transcript_77826/g.209740 Transcript_77826/m.209740 type:complete len:235 (-) Transcript_77826:507-1211(-)